MDLKRIFNFSFITVVCSIIAFSQTTRFAVSTQTEFNSALNEASSGDSIVWESGTYDNIFMDITKNGITVTANVAGQTIMQGASKVEIPADDVVLSGIQFIGGNIGTDHVIRIDGSNILVTQINISRYTCHKYLIVDELSQYVTVSYSNFENRLNSADQNILSLLVDDTNPGYHKVQYCSFKNFEGGGNDEGVEPIRIGVSTQSEFNSRSIVEYCYFTQCDGDGEIISNKASQNIIRYNTFEDNSKAEVVLRHGNEAIVYGNFFINNMGGVRVREGQNHFIFNNYFEGMDRRTIYLQNESSDPLDFIHVYFNTMVNSAEVILGGDGGSNPPGNVTFANNIFSQPDNALFEESTGDEAWIGNISFGSLGIDRPSGITGVDPLLEENSEGFLQLSSTSPAINSAESGYPSIPTFEGLDIDNEILLDLMKQDRPSDITSKDVGASEFSDDLFVQPHVNEDNTGPSYLSNQEFVTLTTTVEGDGSIVLDPASDVYTSGTSVTVTAVPNGNSQFVEWSGALSGTENPQTIVLNEDTEASAVFETGPLGLDNESSIKLFPNPTDTEINFQFLQKHNSRIIIEIYNATGKRIDQLSNQQYKEGVHMISENISGYDSGIYFLRFKRLDSNNSVIDAEIHKFLKR
ncbi:chondroitinase-B domain-containing protein [Ekhidna sp.]